jgi:hypothetical protein
MHDDTVTTSWRRLTDKVRGLRSESVDDAFAGTSRGLPQAACGAVALENLPAAPAAMPHADSMSVSEGEASLSSPAHAVTAAAGCRTDRDAEAIRQAARLANWEDEGGTTSS